MEKNLYGLLIDHLLDHIPKSIKASSFLMDLLGLGRESIYRRIRGEIPFTADEIIKIAAALHVSIDEVIDSNNKGQDKVSYDLSLIEPVAYPQIFQSSLEQIYTRLLSRRPKEMVLAVNSFHSAFLTGFDALFKFSYYQWLCQNSDVQTTQSFSGLPVSPELEKLKEQIHTGFQETDRTEMVLDANVFSNLIKEIEYFHQKKLINDEEKALLKEEMSGLVASCERMAKTGLAGANRLTLFLSVYLPVTSNIGVMHWDDMCQSVFRLDTIPHLIISQPHICNLQQTGIDFLKRQSICITQSNEIMQSEFFEIQRQNVDSL
ncbi:hypothetical protein FACS189421_04820 [Bacteroidia bacterium]|nr:hypothetical protein FACS189421_04820 [Bacteroidia bacterium]GHT02916.1 hypothetical protein FACS189423_02610 [Bacteroidia bacterium]